MKTREIEVWVNPKTIIDNWFEVSTYPETGDIKAKLIIEAPERKIELTESQFEEEWQFQFNDAYTGNMKSMKARLFGSEAKSFKELRENL